MPALLEPSGLPSPGQVVSASPLVTFDASDGGGGVMSAGLLVDGNEVAHQDAGGACREPFVRAAPCPAQLTAALPLTISSLSPGTHTVRVRAVDAAGNVATSAPVTFTAAPPPPTVVERVVEVPAAAAKIVTIRPTATGSRFPPRDDGRSQASSRTRPGACSPASTSACAAAHSASGARSCGSSAR